MDKEQLKEKVGGLDEESFKALENILNDDNADGMAILSVLLAMPDEQFDILRPVFQDAIAVSYNDPQIQMQLVNIFAQSGISIEELINNSDEMINSFFNNSEITLTDSKKEFIKTIFASAINSISSSTINPAHIVNIPVEICRENAKLPTYSTQGSAAMDIYSPEEYTIECGQTIIIPIGIKVAIPHGYALIVQPRSGMSARMKIRIPNSPGLIDEDYHEEIGVIIENIDPPIKDVDIYLPSDHSELVKQYGSPIVIGKGERFAQLRLIEVPRIKWNQVESIGAFEKNHGAGFGSTGVK